MLSFVKIKSSRNGKITQSINDIGKSCSSCLIGTAQVCLLKLFAKIKLSQKFRDFTVANCSYRQGYRKFKDFSKTS